MRNLMFFVTIVMLLISGCGKVETETWKNQLTLGTGMNASDFTLVNESTAFTANTIYFRLESADDMNGSPVRIVITNLANNQSANYDFPSLQSYGHIYISSLAVGETGSYKATGILTKTNKTVASIQFTVDLE